MNSTRLPNETHPSRVHLRTADLPRALGFYHDVLGLKLVEQIGPTTLLSASGQAPAFLALTEDRAAPPRPSRATGLYHLAIRYPTRPDLAQALLRLTRMNYPIEGASDHLVSEAIYLSDPEGNGVELYTDRPRAEWVWRDGQVEMATLPLDLGDLMSTIGRPSELAEPPPATDLGHIHLHVADLAEAEGFFRGFLGLAVTQRSYPGARFFSAGGYHHHIAANTWAGKGSPPENGVGLISYRLEVPGKEAHANLLLRATLAGYKTSAVSENGRDLLQIRDPNGNWLEIE